MISALVSAGLDGGYLTNPRLARVHWQAAGRPVPAPRVSVAGESALWVDPAEIPADGDIAALGRALAAGRHGERDELMAGTAAYTGLRWGELTPPAADLVSKVTARREADIRPASLRYPIAAMYAANGSHMDPAQMLERCPRSPQAGSWLGTGG